MILPETNLAVDALIRRHLPGATQLANAFSNHESIHRRMPGRTRLVVTDAASHHPVAAGRDDVAVPLVVGALGLLLLRQHRGRNGNALRPAPAHEVLDLHPLFLIAQLVVSHDSLDRPSPGHRAVLFLGRARGRACASVHLVIVSVVHVILPVVVDILVVEVFDVVFAVHHDDVIVVHKVFFVCHLVEGR